MQYDKEGNIKKQGNQGAKYKQGMSAAMDRILQKLFHEYGIEDRTSGVALNWYPDGQSMLGAHRHDCWTALFSFGCDRILTIDKTPLLCRDGDLVIFGTQLHGVPIMPEISEGRITVPVFFYPNHLQKKAMWETITDDVDVPTSKTAVARNNARLASKVTEEDLWNRYASELQQLRHMGFEDALANKAALRTQGFDVSAAAQLLLNSMPSSMDALEVFASDDSTALQSAPNEASSSAGPSSAGRWRNRSKMSSGVTTASAVAFDTAASSGEIPSSQISVPEDDCASIVLALQLEEDEAAGCALGGGSLQEPMQGGDESVAASMALAMQMEEEDSERALGADPTMLAAQFAQYEAEFDQADAESTFKTGEHGDLMASKMARETLTLETMENTTLHIHHYLFGSI